jgi:integrase/recombinase XerD
MPEDLKWLKRNILTQALPNGYCGLPVHQGGCPHATACLGCSNFRAMAQFLDYHKRQLIETKKIRITAEGHRRTRQAEMNKKVESSLLAIISTLEQPK